MTDEEPTDPNISTAAIELLALECDDEAREWASMQLEPMFELIAETLRALAAERDAQAAEIERLRGDLAKAVEEAYAEGFAEGSAGDWIEGDYSKPWAKSQALAELTGGKDG